MISTLKKITTKAKQLYKTGKYAKWTDAIKEASKSLHKSASKTVKKHATKVKKYAVKKAKSGIKSLAKKVYESKHLSGVTSMKYIIVKNGKFLTGMGGSYKFTDNKEYAYVFDEINKAKKLSEIYKGSVKSYSSIGSIKKKATKKTTPKSLHKDTMSHNVKISVVSGVSDFSMLQIKRNNESIERLSKVVLDNKNKIKLFIYKTPFWQNYFKKKNKEINDYIKTLKKQNTAIKKHI